MKFGLFYQLPCADWQSPQQRYQDTLDQIALGDELGYSTGQSRLIYILKLV